MAYPLLSISSRSTYLRKLTIFKLLSFYSSTVYNLIEAINGEVEPGEEGLIVWAVLDLLRSSKIK